jgi:hypothetical protein
MYKTHSVAHDIGRCLKSKLLQYSFLNILRISVSVLSQHSRSSSSQLLFVSSILGDHSVQRLECMVPPTFSMSSKVSFSVTLINWSSRGYVIYGNVIECSFHFCYLQFLLQWLFLYGLTQLLLPAGRSCVPQSQLSPPTDFRNIQKRRDCV